MTTALVMLVHKSCSCPDRWISLAWRVRSWERMRRRRVGKTAARQGDVTTTLAREKSVVFQGRRRNTRGETTYFSAGRGGGMTIKIDAVVIADTWRTYGDRLQRRRQQRQKQQATRRWQQQQRQRRQQQRATSTTRDPVVVRGLIRKRVWHTAVPSPPVDVERPRARPGGRGTRRSLRQIPGRHRCTRPRHRHRHRRRRDIDTTTTAEPPPPPSVDSPPSITLYNVIIRRSSSRFNYLRPRAVPLPAVRSPSPIDASRAAGDRPRSLLRVTYICTCTHVKTSRVQGLTRDTCGTAAAPLPSAKRAPRGRLHRGKPCRCPELSIFAIAVGEDLRPVQRFPSGHTWTASWMSRR